MFLAIRRSRPKPQPALRCEVKPGIEILESRQSPSALQQSSLLVAPLVEPLALASEAAIDGAPSGPVASTTAVGQQSAAVGAGGDSYSLLAVSAPTSAPTQTGAVANSGGVANGSALQGVGSVNQVDSGPFISAFHASEREGGWWTFTGVVVAQNPWGLTVHFGGLPTLQGQTTDVQANGTFQLTIRLQNGEEGLATAQTTDWQGQDSNVAQDYVHQSNGAAASPR
jgi:hypothetical protein